MKKLIFTIILLFSIIHICNSQPVISAFGYRTEALNWFMAYWHSDAIIMRISGSDVLTTGEAYSWYYFAYSPSYPGTYKCINISASGVVNVYNLTPAPANTCNVSTGYYNSPNAMLIADGAGGSAYRASHSTCSALMVLHKSSDYSVPIWGVYYFPYPGSTTVDLTIHINASNLAILYNSGGGGGTTLMNEGFELTTFPPSGWSLNPSSSNKWVRGTVSGFGNGAGSAKFEFFTAPAGTKHYMFSTTFNATQSGHKLVFDHAYATYINEIDTLCIWSSTNSGTNWTTIAILRGGSTVGSGMVTAPPSNTSFTPSAGQWARKQYNLPAGTNELCFGAYSQFGNNLYLDNIKVTTETGIKEISNPVPNSFSLSQNYPNPFNPTTNIKFEIPNNEFVQIIVFDITGREIATLVNEKLQAGTYETDWNASNYPSGIYFYRLNAGNFSQTKKMMLIK